MSILPVNQSVSALPATLIYFYDSSVNSLISRHVSINFPGDAAYTLSGIMAQEINYQFNGAPLLKASRTFGIAETG